MKQLPLQASWQDLKDLMRQAGEVIRADVGMAFDGRPKGNGTVVFLNPQEAQNAIRKSLVYEQLWASAKPAECLTRVVHALTLSRGKY